MEAPRRPVASARRRPGVPDQRPGLPAHPGLAVDRIACDGYGSCAELLPEMIALDEWGYPILRPGPVPAAPPRWAGIGRENGDFSPIRMSRGDGWLISR